MTEFDDDGELLVNCKTHGVHNRPWIVCVHVAEDTPPEVAQRVEDKQIAGEVLCAACYESLADDTDARGPHEHLRLACEPCVLDRYKLTTSN